MQPFDHLTPDRSGHFQLHIYATIYHLVRHLYIQKSTKEGKHLESALDTFPFLRHYFQEMLAFMPEDIEWDDGLIWWQEQITTWEDDKPDLPLLRLVTHYDIHWAQRIAFILIGLIEVDSRFGTLFTRLQSMTQEHRPSLELIGGVVASAYQQDVWQTVHPLMTIGIVQATHTDAPRGEWLLHPAMIAWNTLQHDMVSDDRHLTLHHVSDCGLPDELLFPDNFIEKVKRLPELIESHQARLVILRGSRGTDRLSIAKSIAGAMQQSLLEIGTGLNETTIHALLPVAVMTHTIPLLTYNASPGETVTLPNLSPYKGALLIFMSPSGGLDGIGVEQSVSLTIPRITLEYRCAHWQKAFSDFPVDDIDTISARFLLQGETIRQVGRLAMTRAQLDGEPVISLSHVQEACRVVNQQALSSLANFVDTNGTWDQLIVDDATLIKMHELAQRCRYREKLLDHLSPLAGKQGNTGVRALFAGPSGTGKTLAATILAAELNMDLFRVDLSAIVNKYIGETEKNLHKVLSSAEQLDVILLLDEGDALLGNRTDVKSANDRYANLETNFLLQRLERYQGIVIITTNIESAIDTAFHRRIDVLARFELPSPMLRSRIWNAHLPDNHQIDLNILSQISVRCSLSGAQIRNAAHYATLLSLDHDGVITTHDLERAVQEEYRKSGAMSPLNGHADIREAHGGMKAFLSSFS